MFERNEADAGVAERLRRFLFEHFPAAKQAGLTDDAPLLDSGIVDSLGILEIVNFVTETFGVTVNDEDLMAENFATIRQLAAFVERRRA